MGTRSVGQGDVIAFVATSSPEAARAFYEGVLGLAFRADEPDALVFHSGPTMIRVSKVPPFAPAPFTVLGWKVRDILAEVKSLAARGVRFERFPGFTQDPHGIATFPDGTQVAWFKDPDGNMLSLTEFPTGREMGRRVEESSR